MAQLSFRSNARLHGSLVLLWVIIAGGLRWLMLAQTGYILDSDEAIVGLMAKHILEGLGLLTDAGYGDRGGIPIFYYGQPYMGSVEPILVSFVFSIFGCSAQGLQAVPTIFGALLPAAVYCLARRFTDRLGAHIAALLCAFGPAALILWSIKARGGFIELVLLGTVALTIAADVLRSRGRELGRLCMLGFLLGLGWWMNNQAIFYLLAIGLCLSIDVFRKCLAGEFGCKRRIGDLGISAFFFVLGGFPFWYFNLFTEPRFQTFKHLSGGASLAEACDYFGGFLFYALPILFGGRLFWSTADIFPHSSFFAFLGFSSLMAIPIFCSTWLDDWKVKRYERAPYELLVSFAIIVPIVFSFSKFGWLYEAPRYLLPLYSVVFVLTGCGSSYLFRRSLRVKSIILFSLNCLATAICIYVPVRSQLKQYEEVPGQPFVYKGDRVALNHGPLISWLSRHGFTHIHTNYWIGYRLAFETMEKVTFSLFHEPRTVRIPSYESCDDLCQDQAVYVLTSHQARSFGRSLMNVGMRFDREKVGDYYAIYNVHPVSDPAVRLSASDFDVEVSHGMAFKELMFDGNLGTRWRSGQPQAPGMEVTVRFHYPVPLRQIRLLQGLWPQDVGRVLKIEVVENDGRWCQLFDSSRDQEIDDNENELDLHIETGEFIELHVTLTKGHSVFDWSVAELELFAEQSN